MLKKRYLLTSLVSFFIPLVIAVPSLFSEELKAKKTTLLFKIKQGGGIPITQPTTVVVGKNNWIYVLDGVHARVAVFDKNGGYLFSFGKKGSGPAEFNLPVLHTDFAKKYGVSTDTLTNWKRLPFFWDEVALHRNNDFRRFTSDVYYGLTKRAMTGDPRAVELFAKLFEGFSDKIRVEDETPPKELLPDEIAKVKHALYNIGLKAVIKANEPENPDEYEQAALG